MISRKKIILTTYFINIPTYIQYDGELEGCLVFVNKQLTTCLGGDGAKKSYYKFYNSS